MKQSHLFVDEVDLEVRSGAGGDGMVSFRREKFVPRGGPSGGDGGRGGDVVLVADSNVATLLDLKTTRVVRAPAGENGGSWDKKGASGSPIEIRLPVGTLVFDRDGPDPERALVDFTEHGQRFVVARGGTGGLGNARFKTSTRQAPDFATAGKPGETRNIRLSLKLIADVGLVGFPNAGKSTLLSHISAARPRIASYPFTTLVPSLGVVEHGDRRCVVADIPGLIEGASEGAGLGHQFLRHVERTRVLIHLLDLEAMLVEGRDLLADHAAIRSELARYEPQLLARPEIVVLSKGDLVHDDTLLDDLRARLRACGIEPLQISAAAHVGLDALLQRMFDAVDAARRATEAEAAAADGGEQQ